MVNVFTIRGEAGKSLDATDRSLASVGAGNPVLTYRNLGLDTLTFHQPSDIAAARYPTPERGQVVSIWRSGTRVFRGTVTKVRNVVEGSTAATTITAAGPWFDATQIMLSGNRVDEGGITSERTAYEFGGGATSGSLATWLENLVDKAISLGVPMRRGNIISGAGFTIPKQTLQNLSCADAIAEMMRWIPDAVAWFNYADTTGNGLPVFHITRRAQMTAETLAIGSPVDRCDMEEMEGFQVTRVELKFNERAADGTARFATQSSGTGTGRFRQLISISGDELDSYLPPNEIASTTITSLGLGPTAGAVTAVSIAATCEPYKSFSAQNGAVGVSLLSGTARRVANGAVPDAQVVRYVSSGEVPDWVPQSASVIFDELELNGVLYRNFTNLQYVNTGGGYWRERFTTNGGVSYTNVNLTAAQEAFLEVASKYVYYVQRAAPYDDTYDEITRYSMACTGRVIGCSQNYSNTTIYKPADYAFVAPPSGLAAAMVTAQNWVPFQGDIRTKEANTLGQRRLGRKLNVSGGRAAWETANALVQEEVYRLASGVAEYKLGAGAARFNFASVASRPRRSPADNIIFL